MKPKVPINHFSNIRLIKPTKLVDKWQSDFDYSFDGKFWYSQTFFGQSPDEVIEKAIDFLKVELTQITITQL